MQNQPPTDATVSTHCLFTALFPKQPPSPVLLFFLIGKTHITVALPPPAQRLSHNEAARTLRSVLGCFTMGMGAPAKSPGAVAKGQFHFLVLPRHCFAMGRCLCCASCCSLRAGQAGTASPIMPQPRLPSPPSLLPPQGQPQ